MAKPIKLDEAWKKKLALDFYNSLDNARLTDGKISFIREFKNDDRKATVVFDPVAYFKMIGLVTAYSTEVAWHGIVDRDPDDSTKFYIRDIIVYPQTVAGATVNTDQDEYQNWLFKPEQMSVLNRIRFQGHSHVNMGTTPSGTDLTHQAGILDMLNDEDYYIFVIWNKKNEYSAFVFDLKNNAKYEGKDVNITVAGCEGIDEFIANSKKLVKTAQTKQTTCYGGSPYWNYDDSPYWERWGASQKAASPTSTTKEEKKSSESSKAAKNSTPPAVKPKA